MVQAGSGGVQTRLQCKGRWTRRSPREVTMVMLVKSEASQSRDGRESGYRGSTKKGKGRRHRRCAPLPAPAEPVPVQPIVSRRPASGAEGANPGAEVTEAAVGNEGAEAVAGGNTEGDASVDAAETSATDTGSHEG